MINKLLGDLIHVFKTTERHQGVGVERRVDDTGREKLLKIFYMGIS